MKRATRFAVAAVLAGAFVAVAPLPAGACSCVVRDLAAEARAATSVFIATVRDTSSTQTIVRVNRRYKGVTVGDVALAVPGNSCEITFTPGREYLIFATPSGGTLTTDLCAGTTDDLSVAAQLASAGLTPIPRADTPEVPHAHRGASRAVPIAVAAVLAVLLGAATAIAGRALAPPRIVRRAL